MRTRKISVTVLWFPSAPKAFLLGFQANGIVRIYAIGEWYVPCYGMDHICNRQFEKEHAEGIWDMTNLYGRHLFAELPRPLENMMVDHYVT